MNYINQNGFMAFSLILLLSAVVLVIVTTVSLVSIGEMQSSMGTYYGEDTMGLVEGCVEDALLKINNDGSYAVGNNIVIDRPEGICTAHINTKNPWDITVSATHDTAYSTVGQQYDREVRVTFTRTSSGMTLTSWREI
jgi:hypothetical protein